MDKEKTFKIDKQTIILICTFVLLVVGFLAWDNINKREVEFQRDKMEQEKLLEEEKLKQEKSLIDQERAFESAKLEQEKREQDDAKREWIECMAETIKNVNTKEKYDSSDSLCRNVSGFTGVTPLPE